MPLPIENTHADKLAELIRIIERETSDKPPGQSHTAIPGLHFFRSTEVSPPVHTLYNPSLCMVIQGSKLVILEEDNYRYDAFTYLVASVHFPLRGQILEASIAKPFLSLQLDFQTDQIYDILKQSTLENTTLEQSKRGLTVSNTPLTLLDAVLRLAELLEAPDDIPILAPIFIREILYRILTDKQGDAIRQFAILGTQAERIAKVIKCINTDFAQPLPIKKLATIANMSSSSLHTHFKTVTSMSPLQYQKYLRLQEARRLLIAGTLEVANAAFQVGYENPSQFSREYARMFGLSPTSDIKRIRESFV